ncbi:hypothetical protein CBR_g23790 [Chara braunii]|uniref:HECT-type E3 ubiquitin transferase n=1 Tax=Chara braunii TaxID=69332 RepID=A0A388JVI5_CHABU|nr:hypothetical protein CBR_g23790 [Chara braunii]|eukprot:GBG61834.1 hypothetical protein CBR_g23790 [Chara braunii]
MFFGQGERRQQVALRGRSRPEPTKEEVLRRAAEQKAARSRGRKEHKSAQCIQRFVRGYLAASHWKDQLRHELDFWLAPFASPSLVASIALPSCPPSPQRATADTVPSAIRDARFTTMCESGGSLTPSASIPPLLSMFSSLHPAPPLAVSRDKQMTSPPSCPDVPSPNTIAATPSTAAGSPVATTPVTFSSLPSTTPVPGGWLAGSTCFSTQASTSSAASSSVTKNQPLTAHEIARHILAPVLFILRPRSSLAWRIVEGSGDAERLTTAFTLLLKSISNTDPVMNYCTLAVGSSSDRATWRYQSRRLFSLCCALLVGDKVWVEKNRKSLLADRNDPHFDGREAERGKSSKDVLVHVLRLMLELSNAKLWKCFAHPQRAVGTPGRVTSDDEVMLGGNELASNVVPVIGQAEVPVRELLSWLAEGQAGLYPALRSYVLLNCPIREDGERDRQAEANRGMLSVEGAKVALTIGMRVVIVLCEELGKVGERPPDLVTSTDTMEYLPGADSDHPSPFMSSTSSGAAAARASAQLTWYLLTIPLLTKRIPLELLPRFRHPAVLSSCLRTLRVPLQSLGKVASRSSPYGAFLEEHDSPTSAPGGEYSLLHPSAWALFNVLSLAHSRSGGTRGVRGFIPGVVLGEYVHAVCNLLDEWLAFMEEEQQLGKGANWGTDNEGDGGEMPKLKLPPVVEDDICVIVQQWHIACLFEKMLQLDFQPGEERYDVQHLGHMYLGWLLVLSWEESKVGGTLPLLHALAFSRIMRPIFWEWLEREMGLADVGKMEDQWEVPSTKKGVEGLSRDVTAVLGVFCAVYAHLLMVVDDSEFYEKQEPFNLEKHRVIAATLNSLVYNSLQPLSSSAGTVSGRSSGGSAGASSSSVPTWPGRALQHTFLLDATTKLLRSLYERDCRRPFCPPSLWLAPAVASPPAVSAEGNKGKDGPILDLVLSSIPHVLPFEQRVLIFRKRVNDDKIQHGHGEGGLGTRTRVHIEVRRDRIMEDGFAQVNKLGSKMKGRISVSFVNEQGLAEAGIDYGGVFKEFLTDLAKTAFDPRYGLFVQTATEEGLLYPHRAAASLEMGLPMMEFLGRIVGKALYEGILLDYNFSPLFVAKLIGRYSFIDELGSLDAELYRNLMYLKHYEGDARDLALDFTVNEELFGNRMVIELRPGGADIPVTNENKLQYVHAMADYRLNKQMKHVTSAFVRGLSDLIDPRWLRIFNAREFNQLLSGGTQDIDIEDLKENTRYTGGYSSTSRTIQYFWDVVSQFGKEEKCALLKFVTSCSRPPLLGFQHLQPSFTIHKVPCETPSFWTVIGGPDVDRLPSASTCYNTLKLPTYRRAATLREKLLYAIMSNAGFELS